MFRRGFRPGPAIAKGDVAIIESLSRTFSFALTCVLGKHVAKVSSKGRQDGQLQHPFRGTIVDIFVQGDEGRSVLREDAETLKCHHDISRPPIQRMHHDNHVPFILFHIIE